MLPDLHKDKLTGTEYFICLIVLVHVMIGIVSYSFNPSYYNDYIAEDAYIENITALTLFLIAVFFLISGFKNNGWKRWLLVLVAIVFIFGSGEEISWGQRIFKYDTPEEVLAVNTQDEFNIHNMAVQGVKLNKLIFSTIMYSCIFVYFLVLPIVYKYSSALRNWRFMILPVPKLTWGLLYLVNFLLLLLIPHGKAWEIQEFSFAIFLLTSMFYQQNPSFAALVARGKVNYSLAGQ